MAAGFTTFPSMTLPSFKHIALVGAVILAGSLIGVYFHGNELAPATGARQAQAPAATPTQRDKRPATPFAPGPAARADLLSAGQVEKGELVGRGGRSVDLGGKTVAEYLNLHLAAARTGDVKAAYAVYKAAAVCANNNEAVPEFQNDADRLQFQKMRDENRKLCAGVSMAQVQERMAFLAAAARAGNAEAQVDFYMEGPAGKSLDLAEHKDDPVVLQWKEDSVRFLKEASGQCDHFSMGLLSTMYEAGEVVEADPKLSAAYAVANGLARKRPLKEEQLRSLYAEQLADADVQEALQKGAAMAAASCKALTPGR